MKIAYLIVAHNTPNHLWKLIAALQSPNCAFFVHVDRKSDIEPYRRTDEPENVRFVKPRVPVYWADYSTVEAILIAMKAAYADPSEHFDRFVLLSGSDYPIRNVDYIERFFENHLDDEFINTVWMPSETERKSLKRLRGYRLQPGDGPFLNGLKTLLMRMRLMPRRRDFERALGDLKPYGGSTWWALTHAAIGKIVDFSESRPEVLRFMKNTFCPDEHLFQTILANSEFKPKIRRNLTYTDWSRKGSSPEFISNEHLVRFMDTKNFMGGKSSYGDGELLFARKFRDDSSDLVAEFKSVIHPLSDQALKC